MKSAIIALLFGPLSGFAGTDTSIQARMDGWRFDIDTAGVGANGKRVVTRVFISRDGRTQEASLELPDVTMSVLLAHLHKLPTELKKFESFKAPKVDHVVITGDRIQLITDARAFELLRLWLDCHKSLWTAADSPTLQASLRSMPFPPKTP
jgi:hypothetical protein